MDLKYRDRVALVTGSSSGIGRSTALQLAAEGAAVAATYYNDRAGGERLTADIAASVAPAHSRSTTWPIPAAPTAWSSRSSALMAAWTCSWPTPSPGPAETLARHHHGATRCGRTWKEPSRSSKRHYRTCSPVKDDWS